MTEQELNQALENMSEEEVAELLLEALLEDGAPGFITRDEKGHLVNAKILNEKRGTLFEIKSKKENKISEENKKQNQEEKTNEKSFHKGGVFHDTYREQEKYVHSLGNKWASENFEATKPYFA